MDQDERASKSSGNTIRMERSSRSVLREGTPHDPTGLGNV